MMTIRDTHFQGFAKLLYDDIYRRIEQDYGPMHHFIPKVRQAVEQIIARRAFDLAEHVYNHTTEAMTLFSSFAVIAEEGDIPDLTVLPAPQADAPEPAAGQPPATSPHTD